MPVHREHHHHIITIDSTHSVVLFGSFVSKRNSKNMMCYFIICSDPTSEQIRTSKQMTDLGKPSVRARTCTT
jgi:hypothetical protein